MHSIKVKKPNTYAPQVLDDAVVRLVEFLLMNEKITFILTNSMYLYEMTTTMMKPTLHRKTDKQK
jgi:hypothetical protein